MNPSPAEKPSLVENLQQVSRRTRRDEVRELCRQAAAELSRLAGELARVEGERDAARRAQIVRFKVEPWEDGEMVITANGAPMGGTISRSEANAACRWVASAWADLIKANNTPTPPAKEQP